MRVVFYAEQFLRKEYWWNEYRNSEVLVCVKFAFCYQ